MEGGALEVVQCGRGMAKLDTGNLVSNGLNIWKWEHSPLSPRYMPYTYCAKLVHRVSSWSYGNLKKNIRCEIECVGEEKTYPIAFEDDRYEEELRKIKCKIQREKCVCMDIKCVGPFDRWIRRCCVRRRRNENTVGKEPEMNNNKEKYCRYTQ